MGPQFKKESVIYSKLNINLAVGTLISIHEFVTD